MKHICRTLFSMKKLLQLALNLNDDKLRKIVNKMVSDMDKATEEVECIENLDVEQIDWLEEFAEECILDLDA